MNIKQIALVTALVPMCACATVTRGTKEAMVVQSTPVGATVTVSNDKMEAPVTCKTPCSVELKRKRGFDVRIEKEGYETVEAKVATQVSRGGAAGMAGNVLVGGLIGAAVDGTSGAMNEFNPNPLVVTMVPVKAPEAIAETMTEEADDEAEDTPEEESVILSMSPIGS